MNIFSTKKIYMEACLKSDLLHAMTDEERQKLQAHLRQMYKDIETVCKRNNLQMMVGYGSALGALRHKGFIPWDDDIDLLMPRKDYDLFINEYAIELAPKYKVFAPNSKNGPIYRFAKVVDITTRFTFSPEQASEKNGIFIDIFPLENAILDKKKRLWLRIKACFLMYVATSVVGWKSKSKLKRELMISSFSGAFNYYFRNCIGAIFSWKNSEEWFNAFDKAVTGFPESGYYIVPSGGASSKYFTPMAKDIFLPTKLLPFDDIVVNVPNKPEMHCEMEYGDWRQIPPDNMRWQHFIKEISFSVSN